MGVKFGIGRQVWDWASATIRSTTRCDGRNACERCDGRVHTWGRCALARSGAQTLTVGLAALGLGFREREKNQKNKDKSSQTCHYDYECVL